MASDELVERVEERRRPECSERLSERAGQPELQEECHRAARVPLNRRAVSQDEPPALVAGLLGDRGE
jgi:hypothetical protein